MKQYLKYFPQKNILVIEDNELKNEAQFTIDKICNFLDVENFLVNVKTKYNSGGNYPVMSHKLKILLQSYFYDKNEAFFQQIGKRYSWNDNLV